VASGPTGRGPLCLTRSYLAATHLALGNRAAAAEWLQRARATPLAPGEDAEDTDKVQRVVADALGL
jgi:hypothetical protein